MNFYKPTNSGTGSAVQLRINATGDLFWEMAKQRQGTKVKDAIFEFQTNKEIFVLKKAELKKVIDWFKKHVYDGVQCVDFPHLKAKNPKNIKFQYNQYNGKDQVKLIVFPQNDSKNYKHFNFSFEEFSLVVDMLQGIITNSFVDSKLFASTIYSKANNSVIIKSIDLPILSTGQFIKKTKQNQATFLEIVTASYCLKEKKMEYWVNG